MFGATAYAQNMSDHQVINERQEEVIQYEENLSQLIEYLKELSNIETYKSNLSLMNLRSKEIMATIQVLTNKNSGDVQIQFDFYNRLTNPSHHQVTLYAYNYFSYVYVSLFDWLNSLAYFNQAYFNVDDATHFKEYQEIFIGIDTADLPVKAQGEVFIDSLVFLPNIERMKTIDESELLAIDRKFFLNLERLEIPEYLFQDIDGVELLLKTQIKKAHDHFMIEPRVEIQSKSQGISIRSIVDSQLSKDLLAMIEGLKTERVMPDNMIDFGISTNQVSEKLKTFDLVYNHRRKYLEMHLQGITENFNLNIFSDKTANFKSYEFGITYRFQPFEWEMPELFSLNRLSQQELNYLLEEYFISQEESE